MTKLTATSHNLVNALKKLGKLQSTHYRNACTYLAICRAYPRTTVLEPLLWTLVERVTDSADFNEICSPCYTGDQTSL